MTWRLHTKQSKRIPQSYSRRKQGVCLATQKESPYTSYRSSLYTSYRSNEYPKQVTDRLTTYPGVVIAVVNRDTNSSSAGSRMSNVLVAAKLGMRRLFVAQ